MPVPRDRDDDAYSFLTFAMNGDRLSFLLRKLQNCARSMILRVCWYRRKYTRERLPPSKATPRRELVEYKRV